MLCWQVDTSSHSRDGNTPGCSHFTSSLNYQLTCMKMLSSLILKYYTRLFDHLPHHGCVWTIRPERIQFLHLHTCLLIRANDLPIWVNNTATRNTKQAESFVRIFAVNCSYSFIAQGSESFFYSCWFYSWIKAEKAMRLCSYYPIQARTHHDCIHCGINHNEKSILRLPSLRLW